MDDERDEELTTLLSIYPEIVVDLANPHKFTLAIPVAPAKPISITFDAYEKARIDSVEHVPAETRTIRHLPPLLLTAMLLERYPSDIFPRIEIDVTPAWLDFVKLKELENDCARLWEEYGRCQILYTFIDHVQQAADRMFDLGTTVHVSGKLRDALIEYDRRREDEIFNKSSYDCGICLETRRGAICYRIARCGHIFCRPCLQDFFNAAITEGSITAVVCPDTTCGEGKPGQPKKRRNLHPRELVEIGIGEEHARRFVELKRKKKLEGDKSTVFCPRAWCQAAARNNKHPPIPDNLDDYVDPDTDDDPGDAPPAYTKETAESDLPTSADRLTICSNPKCGLAFCRVCFAGWHGEFARCWPRNPSELSAEEKASYDYIRLNTSPCPTCSSPTQKTMGCNHMQCFQCNTHFCYLCGAWLDAGNPYQHFNEKGKQCYQRLWELEEGDEGQGGAFQGARRWEAEARAMAAELDDIAEGSGDEDDSGSDSEQSDDDESEDEAPQVRPAPRPQPHNLPVRVRPPPGPIDPMHAQVLEREAAAARPPEPEIQELYPPNAYPDADDPRAQQPVRGRGRGRRNRGGWVRLADGQQEQAQVRNERLNQQRHRGGRRGRGNARGNHAAGRDNRPGVAGGARVADRLPMADDWEERHNAALRRFVQMAVQDREDEWDSDELDDDGLFQIRDEEDVVDRRNDGLPVLIQVDD